MELFKAYKELFKTYKEAVIAAGSAKHIIQLKSPKRVAYGSVASRDYGSVASREEVLKLEDEFGLPFHQIECTFCNPANYLETLESFLASGKRLKYGDLYVELHGVVTKVLSETDTNTKSSRDHKRYILQAAADEHSDPIKEKQKNKIYKTYKEAVIANCSVKGIHCAMISNDGRGGVFGLEKDFSSITKNTLPCYPSGYLQTLADFLESGMSLTKGDLLINTMGQVCSVNHPSAMGMPVEMNKNRYVLDAMAYKSFDELAREHDNETNQAYEMGIDNTAKQVESLANLPESPDGSEWNGEGLPPVGALVVMRYTHDSNAVTHSIKVKYASLKHCIGETARGLEMHFNIGDYQYETTETPAEREERERLEAAYDLHCEYLLGEDDEALSFNEFKSFKTKLRQWLRIVDKTGYRKD